MRSRLPLLAGAGLLLAAAVQAGESPQPRPEQQRAELSAARRTELGRMLVHDCGSCHGLTMKGGLGSPLLPEALAGKDPDALAQLVLEGIAGTPMPPWAPLLSRDEARWMIDRLREGKRE